MPTAHLLHGFVGAGKTTFARRLEREHCAVRFTHDEWMHKLYGAKPPAEQFRECYRRVDEIIWQLACRCLELGLDVILDYGFWSRESRDHARARLAGVGAQVVLYSIKCPEETMRRRVATRSEGVPTDSLWINEVAFDLFKERFEPLGVEEDHVMVDGNAEPSGGGNSASLRASP